jgi:Flp pilus assembly protein TadB
MIVSNAMAWGISIGATAFLYFLFLSRAFPLIRSQRHLEKRWGQYRNYSRVDLNRVLMDEKSTKSLQAKSKLKSILAHPYPSLKTIEYLLYRSNTFPHLKMHISGQVLGTIIATDTIFVIFKFTLMYSFMLGLCLSLLIHFMLLKTKEASWKKSFIKIFPVSLDIINRGLKSGMTLGRGIAMVSEEVEDPVGNEFNYIASQLQIGITPDDALAEAAARIGIDELRFFALALIIQREMGGSLADILGKLTEVIRERDRFRQKVWTLSSESRATALIVGCLPILLAIMVELISPGYTKFFFTDPKGRIMLWICAGLSVTGAYVITRMMSMEE